MAGCPGRRVEGVRSVYRAGTACRRREGMGIPAHAVVGTGRADCAGCVARRGPIVTMTRVRRDEGCPMRRWKRVGKVSLVALAPCVLAGVALGLGGYTFWYGEGLSYFSNDPKGCANCHVMNDH